MKNYFATVSVSLRDGMDGFIDDTKHVESIVESVFSNCEAVGAGMGMWEGALRDVEFEIEASNDKEMRVRMNDIVEALTADGFDKVETYFVEE